MRRKRTILVTFFLMAMLIGGTGLWLRAQRRQYALNRQLIAALVNDNNQQALALVNSGADPNTPYQPLPMPTFMQLLKRLFHRGAPPANHRLTAFQMACGAFWPGRVFFHIEGQQNHLDAPQLAEAMLRHGANVNARDDAGLTPLHCAISYDRPNTASTLLQFGADVNGKDDTGATPLLYTAVEPDKVRLLLDHGANPNVRDGQGWTPLYWNVYWFVKHIKVRRAEDCIRQLLAHGADPNLPDKSGYTALKYAQYYKCANLVALLKHYGKR
jgi:hypothetical protein